MENSIPQINVVVKAAAGHLAAPADSGWGFAAAVDWGFAGFDSGQTAFDQDFAAVAGYYNFAPGFALAGFGWGSVVGAGFGYAERCSCRRASWVADSSSVLLKVHDKRHCLP